MPQVFFVFVLFFASAACVISFWIVFFHCLEFLILGTSSKTRRAPFSCEEYRRRPRPFLLLLLPCSPSPSSAPSPPPSLSLSPSPAFSLFLPGGVTSRTSNRFFAAAQKRASRFHRRTCAMRIRGEVNEGEEEEGEEEARVEAEDEVSFSLSPPPALAPALALPPSPKASSSSVSSRRENSAPS